MHFAISSCRKNKLQYASAIMVKMINFISHKSWFKKNPKILNLLVPMVMIISMPYMFAIRNCSHGFLCDQLAGDDHQNFPHKSRTTVHCCCWTTWRVVMTRTSWPHSQIADGVGDDAAAGDDDVGACRLAAEDVAALAAAADRLSSLEAGVERPARLGYL